jgi:recombinational DNA repair protein RecR
MSELQDLKARRFTGTAFDQLENESQICLLLERQLAEARAQIEAMRSCDNCKHDRGCLFCDAGECYNPDTDEVSLDKWEMKEAD